MDSSPEHGGVGWEDEVEGEPLFADEIVDSDEEDPPPLPPPMPPLSQLPQHHSSTPLTPAAGGRGRGRGGGGGGGGGEGGIGDWGDTSAAGAADQESGGQAVQKTRAPILTLTIDRIFSEKGLSRIEKEFPKLKFKGKGHEVGDLCYLMQQYEHWANALYPKLTFKDVTDRIEKLATKKDFKSQLNQMRRRWARGPTPPISDDNDSDIADNDRHDNSSSSNHHPGNSPTNEGTESEPRSEGETSLSRPRPTDDKFEDVTERGNQPCNGRSSPVNGEAEERDFDEFEDLLMRESDILREGEEQRRRKRERSGEEEDQREAEFDGGARDIGTQRSQDTVGRGGDKRLRQSCEPEDLLEDLLAEEEEFMHETSFGQQVPPGFDA